jgi:uncharacterized protein (TIGR00290 family)
MLWSSRTLARKAAMAGTAWLWWSSGKDSAWALEVMRRTGDMSVTALITTVTETFDRVSMHAVRREILHEQARSLGIPLHEIRISHPSTNARYEAAVAPLLARAVDDGVDAMAFGDLFLADIRSYREGLLAGTGLEPIFPVWGTVTEDLATEMIDGGLRAVVTCIDPACLPAAFAGRAYDAEFLSDLPADVDPCGENGEFHTCVCDGPFFANPIDIEAGEVVERDGFVFADFRLRECS